MIKVSAILAMLVGLFAYGTAAAQDVPLECSLWGIGCPEENGGDSGGSGGDTGGDTGGDEEPTGGDPPAEEPEPTPVPTSNPCDVVTQKTLPSSASAQGVASSAKGLARASEASAKGVASIECRAPRGRSGRG